MLKSQTGLEILLTTTVPSWLHGGFYNLSDITNFTNQIIVLASSVGAKVVCPLDVKLKFLLFGNFNFDKSKTEH